MPTHMLRRADSRLEKVHLNHLMCHLPWHWHALNDNKFSSIMSQTLIISSCRGISEMSRLTWSRAVPNIDWKGRKLFSMITGRVPCASLDNPLANSDSEITGIQSGIRQTRRWCVAFRLNSWNQTTKHAKISQNRATLDLRSTTIHGHLLSWMLRHCNNG